MPMSLEEASKRLIDTYRNFDRYTRRDQIEALTNLEEALRRHLARSESPSPTSPRQK